VVREDAAVRAGVLIVDDHADFRESARTMLESAGFAVVGEAADGESALASDRVLHPAIVLLDIGLPDMDGFEVADRLAEAVVPPVVVLISSRDARAYANRLATAPVRGFITKLELTGPGLAVLTG
jgi:two-component system response regulator EvgA